MPLVSAFLFPRSHRTPSIMIRGEFFFLIPDPGKDAEDDGKLPREISLNTGFDFLFFFFFFFLRGSCLDFIRGFPFLSSLSLFLFFFSFVIQRCIIQPSSVSIAKIIFQFGADWLPFNLTRFHCRTSFICSKYAHLPLFCLTILILLKKKKERKKERKKKVISHSSQLFNLI